MSHVMSLRWSNDDTYLFSVGGLDCSTFQWKHVVKNADTKELEATDPFEDEPEYVWNANNFGRTMEDILLEINGNPAQGKYSRKTQGPARILTNDFQPPVPDNFGLPMGEDAAVIDQIEDPDDGMEQAEHREDAEEEGEGQDAE